MNKQYVTGKVTKLKQQVNTLANDLVLLQQTVDNDDFVLMENLLADDSRLAFSITNELDDLYEELS